MAEPRTQRTLADRLRARRARRFFGRAAELALFERALAEPGSTFNVLFVHGPAGVGKSSLVRGFVARAEGRGGERSMSTCATWS